jgi:hypothetical protein
MFGKKKHEYRILQADSLINEKQCNELGEQGWKLVSIILTGIMYYYYFVREI